MYPKEVKKSNYKISPFNIIIKSINFIILSIKSLKSPIALIIFLDKCFHF